MSEKINYTLSHQLGNIIDLDQVSGDEEEQQAEDPAKSKISTVDKDASPNNMNGNKTGDVSNGGSIIQMP